MRTFKEIHNFGCIQTLVKSQVTRYQRSLLSQLKFGILPLKIETDRYQGIPLNERKCRLCNSGSIEDETHFLFQCNSLNEARSKAEEYISIPLATLDDLQKLKK